MLAKLAQHCLSYDDRLDSLCMGAGERAFLALHAFSCVELDDLRFASFTEVGQRALDAFPTDFDHSSISLDHRNAPTMSVRDASHAFFVYPKSDTFEVRALLNAIQSLCYQYGYCIDPKTQKPRQHPVVAMAYNLIAAYDIVVVSEAGITLSPRGR
ncbi:MAG TPA: hypothetical protein VI168_10830 [Croceibacterium sp.]